VTLCALRDILSIKKKQYLLVGHLKSRLLDPAIDLINRTTDIRIDYMPYKHGRKVAGFVFDIQKRAVKRKADATNKTDQTLAGKYMAI